MSLRLDNVQTMNVLAYLFLATGLICMVDDVAIQIRSSLDFDLGAFFGSGAMAAAGLLSTMAATSLKELDRRLQRIENAQGVGSPEPRSRRETLP